MIMMYISVFPIAISIRRTNVYEEKSLGMYSSQKDDDDSKESGFSYVGHHLRRQLSFDLWYIFIGFFILAISEGPRLINEDFSMFAVLFEVVSAYGTVGLSLGYTGVNASLSSQFTVIGKLVIIALAIRGRHRGLPYGLDKAILLPSEHLDRKEAEDAELRLQRRNTGLTMTAGRAASLANGRTRSVDRPNVVTRFLHPGPAYPSLSVAKTGEPSDSAARDESLRQAATEPKDEQIQQHMRSYSYGLRPRRTESQPTSHH